MRERLYKLSLLLVVLCFAGCVTVTSKPKVKIDKKRILESNVKLGMAYLRQDRRDSALRAFTKALDVDKNSPEANQGMALIHHVNGESKEAEQRFKLALKATPDASKSDIEFTYARFLEEQKRTDEAFVFFERASKDLAYGRRADALFHLGLTAEKLGDEVRALASFEHALNISPKFAPAALELADRSFAQRDYPNAKKYLDIFARNARQSARSLWLGIRLERIFGNQDKEASYALALKNLHPYSREFLEYKKTTKAGQ